MTEGQELNHILSNHKISAYALIYISIPNWGITQSLFCVNQS